MLIKLKNLFIQEKRVRLMIIVIIVIALGSVLLLKIQKTQAVWLENVKAKKQLVLRMPEIEQQIQAYEDLGVVEPRKLEKPIKDGLVLKGVFSRGDQYYVLIGDKFYKRGDTCGTFNISKIDFDYVILEDKNTKKTEYLHFSK